MIRIHLSTRLGERRWTQADLARMTGIRPASINLLYHDMADHVSLENLDKICEALGCDLHDLIEYIPNDPPTIDKDRQGRPIKSVKE